MRMKKEDFIYVDDTVDNNYDNGNSGNCSLGYQVLKKFVKGAREEWWDTCTPFIYPNEEFPNSR
jgi:hypothetical protein